MKCKALIISISVIVILGILAVVALNVVHSMAIDKVSEKLADKLEEYGMTATLVPAPLTSSPFCLESMQFAGAGQTSITLRDLCVTDGITTLNSDHPQLTVHCREISGSVSEQILDALKSAQKNGGEKNAQISSKLSALSQMKIDADVDLIQVSVGEKGRMISWKSTDTSAHLDRGAFEFKSSAPLAVDIEKAPVAIQNMPNIAVQVSGDLGNKTAKASVTADPALELGYFWKNQDFTISVQNTNVELNSDKTLQASVSNIAVATPHFPLLRKMNVREIRAGLKSLNPSRESISDIHIIEPHIAVDLPIFLSMPEVAESPVVKSLIGFWNKDAGSFLGEAPKASVRKADVQKNKKKPPVVQSNPIPTEKLKMIRSSFDKLQQKITALPALNIQDGHIEIIQNDNHFDFEAISFNTAELFKDSQKFELKFNVRNAEAQFFIAYTDDTPYPTIDFHIARLASQDFLHILNLPIPEHNSGTFSLDLTAAMSDADFKLKGGIALDDFSFFHKKVSPNVIQHINVSSRLEANYNFAADRLDVRPLSMTSGPITVDGFVQIKKVRSDPTIEFEFGAKDIPCEDIPKAIPEGLLPTITDLQMAGTTMSPKLSGTIPWKTPLNASLEESGFSGTSCYPTSVAPHNPEILNDPDYTFTTDYTYFTDAITVGPGTESYVPLNRIPPYVTAAMYLTEDKRVFEHGPLRLAFIERALRLNLNARSYVYGGSTILQQLTKNLFLSRTKNLARKLEEAFIAWRIDALVPKTRVMELYINMIEFGPDIYGIAAAADFYFNKTPAQLTPVEGAFLASLKISPSKGGKFYRAGSIQPDSWWHNKIQSIQNTLAENGYITIPEVIAGYPYLPTFYYAENPSDYRNVWIKNYDAWTREQARQRKAQEKQAEAEAKKAGNKKK